MLEIYQPLRSEAIRHRFRVSDFLSQGTEIFGGHDNSLKSQLWEKWTQFTWHQKGEAAEEEEAFLIPRAPSYGQRGCPRSMAPPPGAAEPPSAWLRDGLPRWSGHGHLLTRCLPTLRPSYNFIHF